MSYHKFWSLQPINQDIVLPYGNIKKIEKTYTETKLPENYKWETLNLKDGKIIDKIYNFLKDNYVEDPKEKFRFNYSKDFLKYALMPPGWIEEWIVAITHKEGDLCGLITGIPIRLNIENVCGINFLCTHKKLRSLGLTPILIKEITRRVAICNVYQAIYTSGIKFAIPIGEPVKYYLRQLNVKKLADVGFSCFSKQYSIENFEKMLNLPVKCTINGWRKMKPEDSSQVCFILKKYLSKFKLYVNFSIDEVNHILLPRDEIISSYVVEEDGIIINFASFYHVNSTINQCEHKELKSVYSYYNIPGEKNNIDKLIYNLLIEANNLNKDVFIMTNMMDNNEVVNKFNFQLGTGNLYYYMYNFSLGELINPEKIGVIMY